MKRKVKLDLARIGGRIDGVDADEPFRSESGYEGSSQCIL